MHKLKAKIVESPNINRALEDTVRRSAIREFISARQHKEAIANPKGTSDAGLVVMLA